MQFGGKVFIIGVGKNEQLVSSLYNAIIYIFLRKLVSLHASQCKRDRRQVPIPVRKSGPYSVWSCHLPVLTSQCSRTAVPEGYSSSCWRLNQC